MFDRRLLAILAILGNLSLANCAARSGGSAGLSGNRETFQVLFRRDVVPARRVLQATQEVVWAVLPQVFADLGYPSGPSARAAERVYLTPPLKIRGRLYDRERNSAYLDCGRAPAGGEAADMYEITFAIMARLRPMDASRTLVEVFVDGTALERTTSADVVSCTSTGRLEAAVPQRLATRITSHSP